jgi:hypothetical protein
MQIYAAVRLSQVGAFGRSAADLATEILTSAGGDPEKDTVNRFRDRGTSPRPEGFELDLAPSPPSRPGLTPATVAPVA